MTKEQLETDRRYNSQGLVKHADGSISFYDNQTDNYTQINNQLIVNHRFNARWTLNVTGTLGIAPAAAAEAKPKTRRSRKPAAKKTDAVEEATVVEGEAKKAAPKKAAAPKAAKPAAPKSAKVAAPKVAKKTNVGKKM